jgi:acetolactate synthase-1/2/3 large subunit
MHNQIYNDILDKIQISNKPVLLIGNGIRLAKQQQVLLDILEKIKIPVLSTWKSFDLIDWHDLSFGRPGVIATRYANFIVQECDLLISLGARLDLCQVGFNYENFAPKAKKIIIDIDSAELEKLTIPNTEKLCISLKSFLPKIVSIIKDRNITYHNIEWLTHCKELQNKYPLEIESTNDVSLYAFFKELSLQLDKNHVVVPSSSGSASEVAYQALKIYNKGTRVLNTSGLGSMGFAIAESIGAYYASNRPIITIEGDGSFTMNCQELAQISAKKLPICIFIVNNGGYNSILNSQNNLCGGRHLGINYDTGLYLPNICNIAKCFNILYRHFMFNRNLYRIPEILEIAKNQPVICELNCNINHQTQPRTKTYRNDKGELVSSTMENMWPFIGDK